MRSGWILLALIALMSLASIAFLLSIPRELAESLTVEGTGFFEYGAVVGYFLCAAIILTSAPPTFSAQILPAIVPVMLGLRELDMDKRYFTKGLFKSSQYFKGEVAWFEIVISTLILLFIVVCAILILKKGARPFVQGLLKRQPWAFAIVAAFLTAAIAKSLDGIGRKLRDFGIEISDNVQEIAVLLEEGLEFAIPAFLIAAALTYRRTHA